LLHEIVHYYADSVFPTPEITLHRQEHYLVNDCLLLDTTTALTNPSSYVYYVFSKSSCHLVGPVLGYFLSVSFMKRQIRQIIRSSLITFITSPKVSNAVQVSIKNA